MNEPAQKKDRAPWFIRNFPIVVKDRFMGLCKMQGKDWKKVLENLIRGAIHEMKKHL